MIITQHVRFLVMEPTHLDKGSRMCARVCICTVFYKKKKVKFITWYVCYKKKVKFRTSKKILCFHIRVRSKQR